MPLKKPHTAKSAKMGFLARKYYQYELWTALYMLEPWEKLIFNSVVLVGTLLFIYTSFYFIPDYSSYLITMTSEYFPDILPETLKTSMREWFLHGGA